MYSISTGLPSLLIAVAGPLIERNLPHALSLSEFSGWRFGLVPQIGVTLITILNMSIFMLCEFVTIGSLYQFYVGPVGYPIVITVGLLTLAYTTLGGLYVSIATDQIQGIAASLLMVIVAIYLGATFHQPLPPMSAYIAGNTYVGLSSIITMPASMFAATVFNEAMWQRAFAAETERKLLWGGVIAAVGSTLMVFICGLCGWLAFWADPTTVGAANINLYMLYGLEGSINYTTGTVNNGMGVVVLMMAVVMNEGVIDSLQNGLVGSSTSFFTLGLRYYRRRYPGRLPADYQLPLIYTRILVVLINIPLIVLGSVGCGQGWSIMSLFLIANMVCCTGCIPLLLGLSNRLQPLFGGFSLFLSWAAGFLSPSLYAIFKDCWQSDLVWDPVNFVYDCVPNGTGQGSADAGMAFAWYLNGYRWEYFMLATGCSAGGAVVCIAFNYLMQQCGIRGWILPGFKPFYMDAPGPSATDSDGTLTGSDSLGTLKADPEKEDFEEALHVVPDHAGTPASDLEFGVRQLPSPRSPADSPASSSGRGPPKYPEY